MVQNTHVDGVTFTQQNVPIAAKEMYRIQTLQSTYTSRAATHDLTDINSPF